MKTTTILAALALSLLPTLSFAQGCSHGMKEITASSCKDGMVWDEAKSMCVVQPTS